MAKRPASQARLISLPHDEAGNATGPTPERARQAGDPLVLHRKSGDFRRSPAGSIESLPTGAVRVAVDPLEILQRRGRLAPNNPEANAYRYQAGRRYEQLVSLAGLDGAIRSPDWGGAGGGAARNPNALTAAEGAIFARQELTAIHNAIPTVWLSAVEQLVVAGFTVERGGSAIADVAGTVAQGVFMDRLRCGLSWLVDRWGYIPGGNRR
jgi:hypothetical protein